MAAVVIAGGSVAGLTAAIALAGQGHDIVVLERGASEHDRPLVSQATHAHTLTSLGVRTLREEAPALLAALHRAGAVDLDLLDALPATVADRARVEEDRDLVALGCRRTTFEQVLLRVVRALPGVEVRHGTSVRALELDTAGRRVTGVRTEAGERLTADIVLDATGRRADSRYWLGAVGLPVADDLTSPSGLSWFSRFYRLEGPNPPGPLNLGNAAGLVGDCHAGLLYPADGGTFAIALGVLPGDQALSPLRHPEGFTIAARLTPGLTAWVDERAAVPLSPVHAMTVPHNVLRGVATTRQRPVAGLFVIGDAACVTDPLFGRGIPLALVHAFRLAELIAGAPEIDVTLSRRVARETEELYLPWYRHSVAQDRRRIARWRAAIAGAEPETPDAGEPSEMTDGALWRARTRLRMGLVGPEDPEAPDAPPDAAGPTAPRRAELIAAVSAVSTRSHRGSPMVQAGGGRRDLAQYASA